MLTHKFLIVFIKVFMFDQYFQAPLALVVTMIVMLAYSFARPFESTGVYQVFVLVVLSSYGDSNRPAADDLYYV